MVYKGISKADKLKPRVYQLLFTFMKRANEYKLTILIHKYRGLSS
ncbi:hypothetical protein Metbo_1305 [Methanobacterium lacus]|uniref:Uncharacterized protein n=1 Tax=Methanobacterium lacus (strain AL-21) TaxID=877455 RepID=F0T7H9_METLA|nr:hypothetical protein Metbo_1305 [Methanobacterium lacus]